MHLIAIKLNDNNSLTAVGVALDEGTFAAFELVVECHTDSFGPD